MQLCDLSFPSPEENLACDEALLEVSEAAGIEILRFWQADTYFAVVGYANRFEVEVNVPFCRRAGIPILRRCSGGGTVLQGPGCLNYSLVLRIRGSTPLNTIAGTNTFVLDRHRLALRALVSGEVARQGHTDLTLAGAKFSGNAQRRRKEFLLFHGTFLLQFDLRRINEALPLPSRQPDYRQNRSHAEFLTNLAVPATAVKDVLAQAWQATDQLESPPLHIVQRLVHEKYSRLDWNLKF